MVGLSGSFCCFVFSSVSLSVSLSVSMSSVGGGSILCVSSGSAFVFVGVSSLCM